MRSIIALSASYATASLSKTQKSFKHDTVLQEI